MEPFAKEFIIKFSCLKHLSCSIFTWKRSLTLLGPTNADSQSLFLRFRVFGMFSTVLNFTNQIILYVLLSVLKSDLLCTVLNPHMSLRPRPTIPPNHNATGFPQFRSAFKYHSIDYNQLVQKTRKRSNTLVTGPSCSPTPSAIGHQYVARFGLVCYGDTEMYRN